MRKLGFAGVCLFAICVSSVTHAQKKYFQNWPDNADPHYVGDRVAMHFLQSAHMSPIVYPEVCAWYGALKAVP